MKWKFTQRMIYAISLALAFFLVLNPRPLLAQVAQVSTATELERLYRVDQLPVYRNGTEVLQFSTYDRKGGNNDGFEGTYSYLYKTGDSSLVVFDAKGKGVIERIWTPTPTEDTLDFYLDRKATPSFSIRYSDLFSGRVFPFVSPVVGHKVGGFYSYLPIPFEKGCKIVCRGKKLRFHQFQYRRLSDAAQVRSFNPDFSAGEKKQLQAIVTVWNKKTVRARDFYGAAVQVKTTAHTLLPGQSAVLANLQSGGRIVGIELSPADAFESLDQPFDLRITWDDEKSPAIYAPVADFFGYAFGSRSMKSLLLGVDSTNRAYCFLPMPFDRKAKIELLYRAGTGRKTPVNIRANVTYATNPRRPPTEGKLYAAWKRESPPLGQPYVFLQGKGKGHYVGTLLQSQGKTYTEFTEFFEGDDSTVIDGVKALHGTGSEDYFNGGWYAQAGGWVERLGTSLHGCLDYSLPLSRTGGYRFYLTDKLPFNREFYHSIEHGPEKNNRAVTYTSVALYYAPAAIEQTAAPTNATARVFIPDTLTFYARLMDHLTYEGGMHLANGRAVLEAQQEGTTNVNVQELTQGNYRLFLDLEAGTDSTGEIAVRSGANTAGWNRLTAGKKWGNFYDIRDVKIDPHLPLQLLFRAGNNRVILHRVMLVKKKTP